MTDRDIAALPVQPIEGKEKRGIHALWTWIQRELHSDAAKTALGAWLALRLYCTLLGIVVYNSAASFFPTAIRQVFKGHIPACPNYFSSATGPNGALTGVWLRWDTAWYAEIAAHGYTCYGSTAFMPLYPMLIRLLSFPLAGNAIAAALLISSIASLVVFYLLYRLAQELTNSKATARASVVTMALYPVSFFLMAGYTEALFLALAIGSYLAARRGSWLAAGVLAALATLTRLQGILLLVPLALEFWLTHRNDLHRWQAWLSLAIAPLALALYMLSIWSALRIFPPWEPFNAVWYLHYAWPWQGITQDLSTLITHPDIGNLLSFRLFDPLTAIIFLVCAVVAFRRLNLPLAVFMAIMWLSSVIKVTVPGETTSISRYMLSLFPTFIVLGLAFTHWPRFIKLGVMLVSLLLLSAYLFIFLIWGWVA
jgi:4-amino-4-deoxy-L-arabinose transferase-like glycosyltransferase